MAKTVKKTTATKNASQNRQFEAAGGQFASLAKAVAFFIAALILRIETNSGILGQGITSFAVNGIAFVFFLAMFYYFLEWTGVFLRLK